MRQPFPDPVLKKTGKKELKTGCQKFNKKLPFPVQKIKKMYIFFIFCIRGAKN
jgi:hypothetical protein